MINPTGYTELGVIGITDKGTYDPNENYVKNDIVHYGGSLWRCKIDDTMNVTPAEGNNWTVFVGEPTNLVERIIAPLEENPATVAYATGRQIIYDDWLWEVIDDIAVGDPLIDYAVDPTNANIKKAVPVETQLLDVKKKEGNLTDLHTTNKTNLVAAVNEVKDDLDDLSDDVGTLSALDTNVKTSTVAAINEVNTKVSKTEDLIAYVQTTLTASRTYAMYEQFVYNGLLYEATTAIAQGATIVINGNCKLADCVTKQIYDLSPFLVNGTYKWTANGISSPGGGCTFPFYIPKRPSQTLTVNSFRYFNGEWHTLTLDPVTQMAKNMFVARAQRISTAFEMALFEVSFTLS